MLRIYLLLALMIAPTAAAHASSLVRLAPPDATPSIIHLGAPETQPLAATDASMKATDDPDAIIPVSPSIIAIGALPPADEAVASIEEADTKRWNPLDMPMVIRGGLFGEAFPTPEPEETAEADAEEWTPRPMPDPVRAAREAERENR